MTAIVPPLTPGMADATPIAAPAKKDFNQFLIFIKLPNLCFGLLCYNTAWRKIKKLIVGLGNPGKKYEKTRHNMGFMVLDHLSDISQIDIDKEVFNGLLGRGKLFNNDVLLFKPTTFMNLSGTAVLQVVNYFKINIEDVIVVFDDMALPVGQIRLRKSGSSGGQKGMQNIIDLLHTSEIKRIRVGIGQPSYDVVDYVLGKPLKEEMPLIEDAIIRAVEALKEAMKSNFEKAMSQFN